PIAGGHATIQFTSPLVARTTVASPSQSRALLPPENAYLVLEFAGDTPTGGPSGRRKILPGDAIRCSASIRRPMSALLTITASQRRSPARTIHRRRPRESGMA